MTGSADDAPIKTTDQSLAIVDYVERVNGATAAEIRNEFNLSKSSVHNHLRTLRENEYLSRFGEQYKLGMKLLKLGGSARNRDPIYPLAEQTVTDLVDLTEEGAAFATLEWDHVYAVHNDVANPNDPYFRMGKRFHVHAAAAGKAILSKHPKRFREEVVDRIDLVELTNSTITSREELLQVIEEVTQRGYAFTDGEYREGLRAVACPISLPDGRVLGALSVGGPAYRIDGDFYERTIPNQLVEAGASLEEQIKEEFTTP